MPAEHQLTVDQANTYVLYRLQLTGHEREREENSQCIDV